MSSLGKDFPVEQARVRELLTTYQELGSVGYFGARQIEAVLQRPDKAAVSGDLPEMISAYQAMKDCS